MTSALLYAIQRQGELMYEGTQTPSFPRLNRLVSITWLQIYSLILLFYYYYYYYYYYYSFSILYSISLCSPASS